jgi:hypothetical protein
MFNKEELKVFQEFLVSKASEYVGFVYNWTITLMFQDV